MAMAASRGEHHQCPDCSFSSDNLIATRIHRALTHDIAEEFQCVVCQRSFASKEAALRHSFRLHQRKSHQPRKQARPRTRRRASSEEDADYVPEPRRSKRERREAREETNQFEEAEDDYYDEWVDYGGGGGGENEDNGEYQDGDDDNYDYYTTGETDAPQDYVDYYTEVKPLTARVESVLEGESSQQSNVQSSTMLSSEDYYAPGNSEYFSSDATAGASSSASAVPSETVALLPKAPPTLKDPSADKTACGVCQLSFPDAASFREHIVRQHATNLGARRKCLACQKQFSKMSQLLTHFYASHTIKNNRL